MVVAAFVAAEPVDQAPPPTLGLEPRADATAYVTELTPLDREALIIHHLPLVRHVVNSMRRYANTSTTLEYDDLLGFGSEGLIAAVDSFDPSYNVRFSTWAVLHIRTTIQDALRRLDPLPRSLRARQKALARVQTALAHTCGAWPSDSDVAQELGISVQHLGQLQQDLTHTVVSLDQAIDGNDDGMGATWLSQLADADPASDPQRCLDTVELRRALREAIMALPARELTVATLHYGQNQSLRAISVRLGVSPSRVSQLHAHMLALLRSTMVQLLEGAC